METTKDYYSLDECIDRKSVIFRLDDLKDEGKIEYSIDIDILEIEDIDLSEKEVDELDDFLYDMDVIPYLEREDEDEDDFDEFYGDFDEY